MNNPQQLKVMAFPAYTSKSNAYNKLLYSAVEKEEVEVIEFTFKRAYLNKADILHVHWPEFFLNSHYWIKAFVFSCALLLSFFALKLKGTKLVWTIHNLKPHQVKHPLTSKIYWFFYKKMVNGVLSMSHANHKIAVENIPQIRNLPYAITFHGLYETQTRQLNQSESRKHLKLPEDTSILLCLGQIKAYKGYEKLIELAQQAHDNPINGIKPIYVLVAGKSDEPEYIAFIKEKTANLNFDLRVGFVSNEDLPHYFKAADISVIPFNAIFNSGSALMSISQEVKTLIPWTPNFEEYADLLDGGLITYENLNQETVKQAIQAPEFYLKGIDPQIQWEQIARNTISLYKKLAR